MQKMITDIQKNQKKMVTQLEHFCDINSGTENLEGLDAMKKVLHNAFLPVADEVKIIESKPFETLDMQGNWISQSCGDTLFIRKRPHLNRRILLSGHMDTVFSKSHPFQTFKYQNQNQLNGPGVTDMKGGLIVVLEALSKFEEQAVASSLGWDVLINADEEIGSPCSAELFANIAKNYQAALVYEPSMTPSGTLAKNRKGSGKYTVIATGKTAHAGRAFFEGRNAITYLAEALLQIHQLNTQRAGVTINIGKVFGGEALNVVPDKAVAKLDIRISENEDEVWVKTQFERIINNLKREDYSLSIEGDFSRPVKKINYATQRLFNRVQQAGEQLQLTIDWQDSGGCCDGNNIAQQGVPVLDTLGVRGGNIHSAEEYILLDSLSERACLSALLLCDLAKGGLEDLNP